MQHSYGHVCHIPG